MFHQNRPGTRERDRNCLCPTAGYRTCGNRPLLRLGLRHLRENIDRSISRHLVAAGVISDRGFGQLFQPSGKAVDRRRRSRRRPTRSCCSNARGPSKISRARPRGDPDASPKEPSRARWATRRRILEPRGLQRSNCSTAATATRSHFHPGGANFLYGDGTVHFHSRPSTPRLRLTVPRAQEIAPGRAYEISSPLAASVVSKSRSTW